MAQYQQIILHVGLSKTGSTSIQANCLRHASTLATFGLRYPIFTFAGSNFPNHSIPVALALSEDPSQYAMGLRRRFGDSISAATTYCRQTLGTLLAEGGETLVVSSERIAGFSETDLCNIRDTLSGHTGCLRVLVYVRSPFELLESTLQERAKAGAVVEAGAVPGRASARCEKLKKVFMSDLETISFHEAKRAAGGVVGDFLTRCGVSNARQAGLEFTVDNTRMSMEAFELMDAINRRFPKGGQGGHTVSRLPGDLHALESLPGEVFRFPWQSEPAVFQAAAEEYRWFESELGLAFPPPPGAGGASLWGQTTLEALGSTLAAIENTQLREFLVAYLQHGEIHW